MSLWHKALNQITGADVVSFCDLKEKEGLRLDYKREIPKKLANIVAAFANTRGGLVLIGVDADKTHNLPIRPLDGMTLDKGLEERITSLCESKICPPVPFDVSPVLDNPEKPGTGLIVIRVPESPEAPHAIDGKVYERVRSQNDGKEFYEHADVENIRHLLERRINHERVREELIERELRRALDQLDEGRSELMMSFAASAEDYQGEVPDPATLGIPKLPIRWLSVIPLYPWRELCSPRDSYNFLSRQPDISEGYLQRVPEGAIHVSSHPFSNQTLVPLCYRSVGTQGQAFIAEWPREIGTYFRFDGRRPLRHADQRLYISQQRTVELAERGVELARDFYKHEEIEAPGYLQVTIGVRDARRFRMYNSAGQDLEKSQAGRWFIDDHFTARMIIPYEEFREGGRTLQPLIEQLAHGFDRAG